MVHDTDSVPLFGRTESCMTGRCAAPLEETNDADKPASNMVEMNLEGNVEAGVQQTAGRPPTRQRIASLAGV